MQSFVFLWKAALIPANAITVFLPNGSCVLQLLLLYTVYLKVREMSDTKLMDRLIDGGFLCLINLHYSAGF